MSNNDPSTEAEQPIDQRRDGHGIWRPNNLNVDCLWFDAEGCGPYPVLGEMELRAGTYSTYHHKYPIDDMTVRVMLSGTSLGGLFMFPDEARTIANQLLKSADAAEAQLAELKKARSSHD